MVPKPASRGVSVRETTSSKIDREYRKVPSVTGRQSSRTITTTVASSSLNNSGWKYHHPNRPFCSAFNKEGDANHDEGDENNQKYDTDQNNAVSDDEMISPDDDDDYVNGGDDRYPFDDDDNDDLDDEFDDGHGYYGRNYEGRSKGRKGGKNRTDPDGYDNFNNNNKNNTVNNAEEEPRRLWLDPKSSIKDRVEIFVHKTPLGSLHPLDFSIGSIDLIKQSCKLDSFEGMKYAHDILDRLIDEKHHVNSMLLSALKENDDDDGSVSAMDNTKPLVIADRPFKFVMFGWACMSHKVKVGPQRMREVLDLMIQEDEYDKQVRQEWEFSRKGQSTALLSSSHSGDQSGGTNDDLSSGTDNNLDDYPDRTCEPTVDIYNTLIQGLSNAAKKSIASAIEAEGVLSTMDRMNRTRGWHTRPNTRSYSLVLGAYANTRHPTAGDRAEAVLREMTDRHVFEKQAYEDEYGVEYDLRDPASNRRHVVTPDIVAYTTVMKAYAQSDLAGSAEKALALLTELLDHEESEKNEENALIIQTDSFAFSTVIQAFARMAAKKRNAKERFEAAQRAEEIALLLVDKIANSKKDSKSTLDTNEEDQDHEDEKSRSRLTGSIVPFNAAINAWAQSFTKESADRAEALLFRLLQPKTQDLIETRPDSVTFNSVAQAWAKAAKSDDSAPDRAEEMLKILRAFPNDDNSKDGSNDSSSLENHQRRGPSPDAQTFVAVMNAYANSRRKDRIFHVHRLLKELTDEFPHKVTAIPYTVLFKAVANFDPSESFISGDSVGVQEAAGTDWAVGDSHSVPSSSADPYAIALECYTDLIQPDVNAFNDMSPSMAKPKRRSGMKVDHFVFATMLDVIRQHTDSESIERRQRVEEIFYDACQAGEVSSLVLKALQNTCPTPYIQELLQQRGRDSIGVTIETINILPREWTRNVPQDFRRVSSRKQHYRKSSKHFRSKKNTKRGDNGKRTSIHERNRQQ